MKQLRGFKLRFYPTSAQRLALAKTFGCSRFVFNWALNLRAVSYQEKGQSIDYNQTAKQLTQLKKEEATKWLKDVSSVPLQQSLKALDTAFKRFFKKQGGYPKFKRKSNRQSITYQPNAYSWRDGKLTLAKMKQPLKIKWSRRFKCKWHSRDLVKIDRWYPSSKTCNSCGYVIDKLPLSIRQWTCPSCNSIHSRDINAAKNILEVGTTLIARGVSSNGESLRFDDSSNDIAKRESPTIDSSEAKAELIA